MLKIEWDTWECQWYCSFSMYYYSLYLTYMLYAFFGIHVHYSFKKEASGMWADITYNL